MVVVVVVELELGEEAAVEMGRLVDVVVSTGADCGFVPVVGGH